MVKPMNHEEAKLPHSQRLELFLADVWGAMDAHGVNRISVAHVLTGVVQDLLWEYTPVEPQDGE